MQCKLYHSTHCWLNILVGTWSSLHCVMDVLKAYNVTLTSSFFIKGLALHCLVSSRPWEARCFMFDKAVLGVVKCCNSCVIFEWYTIWYLGFFLQALYRHESGFNLSVVRVLGHSVTFFVVCIFLPRRWTSGIWTSLPLSQVSMRVLFLPGAAPSAG